MKSGILSVIARNANQDAYITGDPKISYFKTIYNRHTNFNLESVNIILKPEIPKPATPPKEKLNK